jgi:hypothetical protein
VLTGLLLLAACCFSRLSTGAVALKSVALVSSIDRPD